MGCLPRSACLGSRCLTHHKDLLILGESLEIWNYQVWYVPSKVMLDAMTIHFEIWPVGLRKLTSAVRKYSSEGEESIPDVENTVFDLRVMEPLCFGLVDQRVLIGMITKFIKFIEDRWVWDMNEDGVFRVKDVRNLLDETFLPNDANPTRWIKSVPIKINVFAWKVYLDRLPTRSNLTSRDVAVSSLSCPICNVAHEDTAHLLFSCRLATDVVRLVCRWWNLVWLPLNSYPDWLNWFKSL
ncbi:RNA-directed DNA polymerase, eukaryota [Tanacetum coccineum]